MSNIGRTMVSKHFSNYECMCHCDDPDCDFGGHTHVFKSGGKKGRGQSEMHPKILSGTEKLRALACEFAGEDVPLRFLSAARCGPYNRKIDGHPNSQHLRCAAVDVQSQNPKVSNAQLALLALQVPEFDNGGIGVNENAVHLDVGKDTFWFYTEKAEAAFRKEIERQRVAGRVGELIEKTAPPEPQLRPNPVISELDMEPPPAPPEETTPKTEGPFKPLGKTGITLGGSTQKKPEKKKSKKTSHRSRK